MKRFILLGLISVLSASAVMAGAGRQQVALTDLRIRDQLEHKLSEEDISGVSVAVRDAVVMLSGVTRSVWAKKHAIRQAQQIEDVRGVVSDLTVEQAESDELISIQIGERLRQYTFYTIFDEVDGTVKDGFVTLAGRVTGPHKAQEIGELASRVYGVQDVKNEIRTLPVSSFDDRLRVAIERAIYTDSVLQHYANLVNPPIHIIVENGHVTLSGVVSFEMERLKAESLARGAGPFTVENKLRTER